MKCPADGETLIMADRSGAGIDYCPKCRGVWPDRGELDRIIGRCAALLPAPLPQPEAHPVRQSGVRTGSRTGMTAMMTTGSTRRASAAGAKAA